MKQTIKHEIYTERDYFFPFMVGLIVNLLFLGITCIFWVIILETPISYNGFLMVVVFTMGVIVIANKWVASEEIYDPFYTKKVRHVIK